jgi:hypothetical protein
MVGSAVRSSVVERETMYSLKRGVSIHMTPELEKMLDRVCMVFKCFDLPVVITSGVDGPHRENSLHYKFRAIDIRKNFDDPILARAWNIHHQYILDGVKIQFSAHQLPARCLNEEDHLHIEWNGP